MTTTAPTEADLIRQAKNMPAEWQNLGYHELNAMLNLYGADGRIQFEADHAAARQYFCLLYTSPSPRDATLSRMPSSA